MPASRSVTAVLGPTNTGKTHLAVERMLAHGTGMIGLPLRLLAREIYDRVRLRVGDHAVALVTGEEKIIPATPRFWVATVEAMPSDIDVNFLAIDEIQLCADFERGHIFTDRLLNRRGREETMLLGAATMRPIIEQLVPGTTFIARPRFSKLAYAGTKKLSRLPRRSAVVAFSAETVYAVAELIRRQRGGAAVVLGALSPRTRNAQVALFQSGDVDYLVATDAIGMGLNMDVDHVAFAATRKFDGFHYRNLNPGELGQIAGRAGRYLNDGTFGTTGDAEPFDADTVERLETHKFDNVHVLQWRNRDLDFRSIEDLKRSLGHFPRIGGLTRAQAGPDVVALDTLSRDEAILGLASGRAQVSLLWDVCQIPDYRNISSSEHASLIGRIFEFLSRDDRRIPEDWFARQLSHCDRSDGDIDTLSNRIAHVRTWTFVANRTDWLEAPLFWQSRTREIEDKLSDALHERLTQRFIDRRTSVLMRRLAQKEELMSTVEEDGALHVEGEYVGRIKGFHFIPDGGDGATKTVKAASLKAVASEIAARAQTVAACPDPDLSLTRQGQIVWQNAPIAKLEAGPSLLKPRIVIIADNQLSGSDREAVQARLEKFLSRHIANIVEPLTKLEEGEGLAGTSRGIAFRLVETLGVLPRDQVAQEIKSLSQEERAALRKFGVRFGAFNIFVPLLLKPAATQLRLLLWGLEKSKDGKFDVETLPESPGQGLTSALFDRSTPRGFYGVCGYRICGPRVVRIDMLERLADMIRDRVFWRARFPEEPRPQGSVEGGGFAIVPDMMSLVGCSGEEFEAILRSLDFRMQKRKVKRPASATATVPEAQAAAAEGATAEAAEPAESATIAAEPAEAPTLETPPLSEPEPEATVETVVAAEATEIEAAEPAPEAPAEMPAEGTEPITVPETPDAQAAVEPAMEEVEIDVWWPKDTGPFRRERPKPDARPQQHRHKRKERTDRKPQPEGSGAPPPKAAKPQRPRPERRPEKPIDPDSPFAVLGALKAQLAKKT
ncbi:helicase-related protein [Taklimakanibacter deserti]|uniref:helicase-related protein n=1 Tax=Taklimakanibacter deserti TaxID=2267839 RepID=UPI000E6577FE